MAKTYQQTVEACKACRNRITSAATRRERVPRGRILYGRSYGQRRLGHDFEQLLGLDLGCHAGRVMPVGVVPDQCLLLSPVTV